MTPSRTLSAEVSEDWLAAITQTEGDVNQILSLISHKLYHDGKKALQIIQRMHPDHANVQRWPSCFSGITVICNRKTPTHRDKGGRPEWFDILVSAGSHTSAHLDLPDLSAQLLYTPGTTIAICGKLFRHGVQTWEGGERLCYAHYLRNNVLNRLSIAVSSWVHQQDYFQWMSSKYLERQGLLDGK